MEGVFVGSRKARLSEWAKSNRIPERFSRELFRAIDQPSESPFLMEPLIKGFRGLRKRQKMEVRKALIRIQMGCSLNSHSDHVKAGKQLFVSQAIEKIFFGSNFLSSEDEKHLDDSKNL
jgi:hypothetical protein